MTAYEENRMGEIRKRILADKEREKAERLLVDTARFLRNYGIGPEGLKKLLSKELEE